MGVLGELDPMAPPPPQPTADGETVEPERKRLKKIDFRYTAYVNPPIAFYLRHSRSGGDVDLT